MSATELAGQGHKGDTLGIAHAACEEAAARAQQVGETHHPRAALASSDASVSAGA